MGFTVAKFRTIARGLILALGLQLVGLLPALAQDDTIWRELNPENTVVMQLHEGEVYIELNPLFAHKTVKRFKELIDDRFYNALTFYRVIDGFVAQGGDQSDLGLPSSEPTLDAEFEIDWSKELPFVSVKKEDLFDDETGFIDGFAVGRDIKDKKTWILHCPGVVAMARGNDADSGRTDFYIVIGQAPRYLDRNLTVFGRVVVGMDIVQRIKRGPANKDGIITGDYDKSRIRTMKLFSDIPEQDRLSVYTTDTSSKPFASLLKSRKNRKHAFFHSRPPKVLDACQVPVSSRTTK